MGIGSTHPSLNLQTPGWEMDSLSKKGKGLMDTDDSAGIVVGRGASGGGRGQKGDSLKWKKYNEK